jgi:hypothetical protein
LVVVADTNIELTHFSEKRSPSLLPTEIVLTGLRDEAEMTNTVLSISLETRRSPLHHGATVSTQSAYRMRFAQRYSQGDLASQFCTGKDYLRSASRRAETERPKVQNGMLGDAHLGVVVTAAVRAP